MLVEMSLPQRVKWVEETTVAGYCGQRRIGFRNWGGLATDRTRMKLGSEIVDVWLLQIRVSCANDLCLNKQFLMTSDLGMP